MPVVETVAAIIGIVAGTATCANYARQIAQNRRQKKALAAQANTLQLTLTSGGSDVQQQLRRLRESRWSVANPNAPTDPSILEAQHLIASLQALLLAMASPGAHISAANLADLQRMADRSRALTLNSLQQMTRGVVPSSSSALVAALPYHSAAGAVAHAPAVGRTQLNIHNLCPNARLYRMDRERFERLATALPHSDEAVWRCRRCAARVSDVSLRLAAGSQDRIWIGPVGFFKAHCEQRAGRPAAGWTCIWPVVADACRARFDAERGLLEHMRDHHVCLGSAPDQNSLIDWPADFHYGNAATCGFGARIRGYTMQSADGGFLVPASPL